MFAIKAVFPPEDWIRHDRPEAQFRLLKNAARKLPYGIGLDLFRIPLALQPGDQSRGVF